ncbi:annexin A11-like [Octopus bimaculoides]|uniref:annexin A11-like n=1 Tax=Octopus bimaculoides TaxID=37653 RepID=UPI0022DF88F0|nr:annexin A11-like [Octopus bimaculoides]
MSALGPPPSYDSVMQGEAYSGVPPHGPYQPAPPYTQIPGYGTHPQQPYNPSNIGYTPYGVPPQPTAPPIVVTGQPSHVQTYPTTVIDPTGQTTQQVPNHSRRRIMAILLVIFLPLCLFIFIYLLF